MTPTDTTFLELLQRRNLYRAVRAGLMRKGVTISEWCAEQGISRAWFFKCLSGKSSGPAAKELLQRILSEVGLA